MRASESSQLILNSSIKKPRRDQISDNESVHKISFDENLLIEIKKNSSVLSVDVHRYK
jgi:hypothetical protein